MLYICITKCREAQRGAGTGLGQMLYICITKRVDGRDAEQELVSTVSRARRGTGTGIVVTFLGAKKRPLN